jgi:hypothetical protein
VPEEVMSGEGVVLLPLLSSAGLEQALARRSRLVASASGRKRREDARIMIPHHGSVR